MFSPRDYLFTISVKRKEFFIELLRDEGLNLIEVEILLFLYSNPNSNTLTEIINAKDFTKSHASKAISYLVSEEYLSRNNTNKNRKEFRLKLLPKGEDIVKKAFICIEEFQKKALMGITEVEINQIDRLLKTICDNLKEKN